MMLTDKLIKLGNGETCLALLIHFRPVWDDFYGYNNGMGDARLGCANPPLCWSMLR